MSSIINASVSSNGIVSTADASGILLCQSNGKNTNAQAWLCYNGGTAIRASYNVSSVTVNGTGDYTINFTSAMSSANYALVGTCSAFSTGAAAATVVELYDASSGGTDPTTTTARIYVHRSAVGAVTVPYVNIAVFG